jgi:hypothetical protein
LIEYTQIKTQRKRLRAHKPTANHKGTKKGFAVSVEMTRLGSFKSQVQARKFKPQINTPPWRPQ